jgi:TolA-binding protein|tara:strand:- start:1140 stop:1337 length:198 start_codon:yes stop_codon:yes gene_type:complete
MDNGKKLEELQAAMKDQAQLLAQYRQKCKELESNLLRLEGAVSILQEQQQENETDEVAEKRTAEE